MAKRKHNIGSVILNLLMLLPSFMNLANKVISIVGWEARIAAKSVVSLVILSVFFGVVLTSIWFSLLALIFIWFISFWSIPLSIFFIILINLVILLIVGFFMAKSKRKLTAPFSWQYFKTDEFDE